MISRILSLIVSVVLVAPSVAWVPALSHSLHTTGLTNRAMARKPCQLAATVAILRSGEDKNSPHRSESALQGAKEPAAAEKFFAEFDHWYHPQEENSPASKFFAEFDYWYHLADSKPKPLREVPPENKSANLLSTINFDDVDLHLIWPTDE